jgi:hypothetical protein
MLSSSRLNIPCLRCFSDTYSFSWIKISGACIFLLTHGNLYVIYIFFSLPLKGITSPAIRACLAGHSHGPPIWPILLTSTELIVEFK